MRSAFYTFASLMSKFLLKGQSKENGKLSRKVLLVFIVKILANAMFKLTTFSDLEVYLW